MLKMTQTHLLEYLFIKRRAHVSYNELNQTLEVEASQADLANKCTTTIQNGVAN